MRLCAVQVKLQALKRYRQMHEVEIDNVCESEWVSFFSLRQKSYSKI